MLELPGWFPRPELVGIPFALLVTVAVTWWFSRRTDRWGGKLRERFVMGVPLGSFVVVAVVLFVYLFVQRGFEYWFDPVTVAFSSWSYLYPLGVVTAPFAHAGPGHLIGNLAGTAALAPLAEYIFGHFPRERGSASFSSWHTNPWVRSLVVFPGIVVAVGVLTSVFAWGPVIGFSGVVFAFAGFAVVRYPLGTVIVVAVPTVLRVVYNALRNPVVVAEAAPSFGKPWWAGIAIQGHALGLFLGLLLGVLLLWHREEAPNPTRVAAGVLLLAYEMTPLWAIWWFRGEGTFVLYRGLGVIAVFALVTVVVLASRASPDRLLGDVTGRQLAAIALVLPLVTMAFVAVPLNLSTVEEDPDIGQGPVVEVRDYDVAYAERVQNGMVSLVNVSIFGETTQVTTSGVIVVSEERRVWTRTVSKGELAFKGDVDAVVGGLGWRETVHVTRRGWVATGGEKAYNVWIGSSRDDLEFAYASKNATADLIVDGYNVTIEPREGEFHLVLSGNESRVSAPMPAGNETVVLEDISFTRRGDRVQAVFDRSQVTVATVETYPAKES